MLFRMGVVAHIVGMAMIANPLQVSAQVVCSPDSASLNFGAIGQGMRSFGVGQLKVECENRGSRVETFRLTISVPETRPLRLNRGSSHELKLQLYSDDSYSIPISGRQEDGGIYSREHVLETGHREEISVLFYASVTRDSETIVGDYSVNLPFSAVVAPDIE